MRVTISKYFKFWQRALSAMVATLLMGSMPLQALAAQPSPVKVPPPAMPAHVRKGAKKPNLVQPKLMFSSDPTDVELSSARVFDEPLIPMQTPVSAGENKSIAASILAFKAKNDSENVSDLTSFIARFPQSRWRPSLELNL